MHQLLFSLTSVSPRPLLCCFSMERDQSASVPKHKPLLLAALSSSHKFALGSLTLGHALHLDLEAVQLCLNLCTLVHCAQRNIVHQDSAGIQLQPHNTRAQQRVSQQLVLANPCLSLSCSSAGLLSLLWSACVMYLFGLSQSKLSVCG